MSMFINLIVNLNPPKNYVILKQKYKKTIPFLNELTHKNLSNHNIMTTLTWLEQSSPELQVLKVDKQILSYSKL